MVPYSFDDPKALVPRDLNEVDSHAYELMVVRYLQEWMMVDRDGWRHPGLLVIDDIELVGLRPDTQVVFRYHHRPKMVEKDAELARGPLAEAAGLWDLALTDDPWAPDVMDGPAILATAIGSAFDAAELPLVDSHTLQPIGRPPRVYPRLGWK